MRMKLKIGQLSIYADSTHSDQEGVLGIFAVGYPLTLDYLHLDFPQKHLAL